MSSFLTTKKLTATAAFCTLNLHPEIASAIKLQAQLVSNSSVRVVQVGVAKTAVPAKDNAETSNRKQNLPFPQQQRHCPFHQTTRKPQWLKPPVASVQLQQHKPAPTFAEFQQVQPTTAVPLNLKAQAQRVQAQPKSVPVPLVQTQQTRNNSDPSVVQHRGCSSFNQATGKSQGIRPVEEATSPYSTVRANPVVQVGRNYDASGKAAMGRLPATDGYEKSNPAGPGTSLLAGAPLITYAQDTGTPIPPITSDVSGYNVPSDTPKPAFTKPELGSDTLLKGPVYLDQELLHSVLKKHKETKSIDYLQPFYEKTITRFLHLQNAYGEDNVKLSFIIVDWDETLHSWKLTSDSLVSDFLIKIMSERKVTVETTSGNGDAKPDEKEIIIVPFPLIVTCHSNYLNMMLETVRGNKRMMETANLVMGADSDSGKTKTLVELELKGGSLKNESYIVKKVDKNNTGKFEGYEYGPDSYSLPELVDKLKRDGVIREDLLSKEEVSRIRAYAIEDRNYSLGTSINNNLRKLSEWKLKWKANYPAPPRYLRIEVPELLDHVAVDFASTSTNDGSKSESIIDSSEEPLSRLNQIPFISVDVDLYYGHFLYEDSDLYQKFSSTKILKPDFRSDFLIDQSLAFKTEMYKRAFSELVNELRKQNHAFNGLDMSKFFWDIISIGDAPGDHEALDGILGLSEEGLFTQGVKSLADILTTVELLNMGDPISKMNLNCRYNEGVKLNRIGDLVDRNTKDESNAAYRT